MIMRCSTGSQCTSFQVDAQCSHVQWTGMALSFEGRCKRELKRSGCPLHNDAEDNISQREDAKNWQISMALQPVSLNILQAMRLSPA